MAGAGAEHIRGAGNSDGFRGRGGGKNMAAGGGVGAGGVWGV